LKRGRSGAPAAERTGEAGRPLDTGLPSVTSLEQAELLAELSPAPIFVVEEGALTFVNRACAALLGYTPAEMVARGLHGAAHPDDLAMVMRHAAVPLEAGSPPRQYVLRFVTKSGETRWGAAHVAGVEIDGRKLSAGTLVDITDRVVAETALAESERRWRALVQTAPSLITMVDRQGTVLSINRTVTGVPIETVLGTNLYDHVWPESRAAVREAIGRVFRERQARVYRDQGRAAGP
jgi:PAS domain S-box-containing protein